MKRQKINSRGNTASKNILYLFHRRAFPSRFSLKAGFKHLHSAPFEGSPDAGEASWEGSSRTILQLNIFYIPKVLILSSSSKADNNYLFADAVLGHPLSLP